MSEIAMLYRRWLGEAWQGDLGVLPEICAPGITGHWPGQDVHSLEQVTERIGQTFLLFEDVSTSLDVGPIVDGDLVAAHWTFAGVYRGGIPGATAAPGTKVSFTGTDVLRVENGRFAEYWVVSDVLGLMTRLGAIPG